MRAFKFAMDVPPSRQAKLFAACDALCEWRYHLLILLSAQRAANRKRLAAGEPPEAWLAQTDLYKLVTDARAENDKLGSLHTHLVQNVCIRVIEGTKRWLEAIAEGDTGKRPPPHRDPRKYRSFTFPEYGNGCRINNGRILLSGFGWFKLHDHRKIRGRPKTITVKFAQGRWWCTVTTLTQEHDWFGPKLANNQRPVGAGVDP